MKRIESASMFGSSGLRARLVSIWRNSILALAAGSLGLLSTPMLAQGFQGDYQGCAADRPCFNGAHQEGNKVVFNFTGVTGWDFYNVRYKAVGGGEKQVENRSGHFTLNNVKPGRVYTLKVQGCNSHFLGHSTCSPWNEQSVTTR
jgi:hypothetical protein